MKKFPLFLLVIAVVFMNTSLHAASKPKAKATPPVPHHTLIASVNPASITVHTLNTARSYKIIKSTAITYDGKPATVNDLKPGMKVSVTAGMDPTVASIITATKPPKDPPAAAKGKGKGK